MSINTLVNVKSRSVFFRRLWKSKRAPKAVQRGFQGGFWMILGSIWGRSAQEEQPEGRVQDRRGKGNQRAKGSPKGRGGKERQRKHASKQANK